MNFCATTSILTVEIFKITAACPVLVWHHSINTHSKIWSEGAYSLFSPEQVHCIFTNIPTKNTYLHILPSRVNFKLHTLYKLKNFNPVIMFTLANLRHLKIITFDERKYLIYKNFSWIRGDWGRRLFFYFWIFLHEFFFF